MLCVSHHNSLTHPLFSVKQTTPTPSTFLHPISLEHIESFLCFSSVIFSGIKELKKRGSFFDFVGALAGLSREMGCGETRLGVTAIVSVIGDACLVALAEDDKRTAQLLLLLDQRIDRALRSLGRRSLGNQLVLQLFQSLLCLSTTGHLAVERVRELLERLLIQRVSTTRKKKKFRTAFASRLRPCSSTYESLISGL